MSKFSPAQWIAIVTAIAGAIIAIINAVSPGGVPVVPVV